MQGEKSWQLRGLSSKAGVFLSPPARVAALVFFLLCKGSLTQRTGYTITVPKKIHVPRGFCVHVPCKFTTPERYSSSSEPMYGYWFRIMKRRYFLIWTNLWVLGYLMATNDARQNALETHMKLTGDPAWGDCSFSIVDAGPNDLGWYYFRIDKGQRYRHDFRSARSRSIVQPEIVLTDRPNPTIQKPAEIIWGQPATFVCEVPNVCSDNRPQLAWRLDSNSSSQKAWSKAQSRWAWTYGVNVTFMPSLADEGKDLTCLLKYPKRRTIQSSTRLDLGYKPALSSTLREGKCSLEDESFTCACSFHAWPPPQILWNVDGKNLTDNGTSGPLWVTVGAKGNEVYSILHGTGSLVQDHSITCIGTNPFGTRVISIGEKKESSSRLELIPPIVAGSFLVVGSGGILLHYLR